MLVLSTGIVGAVQTGTETTTSPELAVDEFTLSGDSILGTEQDDTLAAKWMSTTVTATVEGSPGQYQTCLVIDSTANERAIECEAVEVNASGSTNVTIENPDWPSNTSGHETLTLVVRNSANETLSASSQQVNLLRENGDPDDDGVPNQMEINESIDPTRSDTDKDGLSDGKELYNASTNPNKKDTDGDDLADNVEANKHASSPLKKDTDGDRLNDSAEINDHGTKPHKVDSDGDTLSDWEELKEHETNPNKADSDGDDLNDDKEIGNTDPWDPDSDGDGLSDGEEASPPLTNPTDPDTDGDGLDDGIEVNKYNTEPHSADTDGDGVEDGVEIERGTDPGGTFFLFAPLRNPIKTAAVIVGLIAVVGAVHWWRRRAVDIAQTDEAVPVSSSSSLEAAPNAKTDGEDTGTESATITPPLTDEDRIEQLLDESGGRLHQSEIVSKTGWSKSKVSRLLSRMEENGQITKISVGRENLITRSGDEPRHAGSAFED